MRTCLKFGVLLAVLCAVSVRPASAVPITGAVTLSQSALVCPGADCLLPVLGTGVPTTLDQAVALDFTNTGAPTPNVAGPMSIDGGTGTFAGILGTGTIKDFCFVAGSCGLYPGAPLAAWQTSAGGATFDLLSVVRPFVSPNGLVLTGTGLFHIAGFDNTPGTFTLAVTNTGSAFSFSATDAATAVPEPASLLLLGSGVVAAVARRRRP
jgi:PEP-CTERM motif